MSARDLIATPGQTVGPFFHDALPFPGDSELVPPGHADAVRLHGQVLDGAGAPVPDALIELWQADADGRVPREPGSLRRDGFTFTGWGRAATDDAGHYSFSTVRPGPVVAGSAPFFALTVFARGLPNRLFTRAYLPADDAARSADPLLSAVEEGRRDHAGRRPRRAGLPLRHPAAGRGRDRLPHLSATLTGMADLLWPGDERAGDLFSDAALLKAMVDVESAWLAALVSAGIAPSSAGARARRPGDARPARAAGAGGRERRQPRDATGLLAPGRGSRTPPPRRRGGCIAA